MDPASKQDLKYSYKGMMNLLADKTAVGMAKIRGEESATLDVAIVKATLQDEVVPKEKHVRTLKIACSGSAPRQQVNYVIHGLAKRLEDKPGWLIALKTFIVFHRLMREVDSSFQEEVLRYQERTGTQRLLRLDTFADHTTKETWDYSAWIRVYSVYLDERLAVFRLLKFDPEQETAQEGKDSKLKSCSSADLLEFLPQVHKLLSRLITCVPEGAAQRNEVVLQACAMVLREVRAVYKVVCEGVINLADKFFEMDRNDAMRGLELYKDNIALNDKLNGFFAAINNIQPLRGAVQFPTLQSLPSDFLVTLEEYVKDAPRGTGPDPVNASGRKPTTISTTMNKATAFAARGAPTSSAISGGTALVVGGPTTTGLVIGGPTGAAPPPEPPKVVDLLDFSDSITPTPAPTAAQGGAMGGLGSPAASQQFDFFGNPITAGAPGAAAAHAHAAAPAGTIPGASQGSAYMTFGAAPHPQQPQQQQQVPQHAPPQQIAPSVFEQPPPVYQQQHTGYGQPPPYQTQQTGGYVPQQTGGYAPQQTGGYQPQQTGGYAPQYTGQAPPQQQPAPYQQQQQQQAPGGGWNAFGGDGGFGGKPANGAPDHGFAPFGNTPGAQPQQQQAPAVAPSSNPFGANPFASSGPAPVPQYQPQPTGGAAPATSNPFGANPFAGPAWGPPGAKGQDPLGALSADVWGGAPAAHAATFSPPLKDIKKTNGQGSPGAFF